MSKKVVFFFPSFASSEATAPLGILAVAAPLLLQWIFRKSSRFNDYTEFQETRAGGSEGHAMPRDIPGDRAFDPRNRGNRPRRQGVEFRYPYPSRRVASIAFA